MEMSPEHLYQTVGRIDANVAILVADSHVTKRRLGAVEKRQWAGIGALTAAGALLAAKYHELLPLFSV